MTKKTLPWYDLTPVLRALAMPGDLASGPASPTRGVAVRETQQLAQALVLEVMPGVKVRMHPYMSEASGDLVDLVRTTQDTVLRVGVTKTTGEMKDGRRQGEMTMLSRLQGYLHGARPLVSGELWLDLWVSVVPHGQNCEEDLLKQAELIKANNTLGKSQKVWVYRNAVWAMPWMSHTRKILDDPAYDVWFLKFKNGSDGRGPLHHDGDGTYKSSVCDHNFSPPKCSEL